jgi:signal transduction histidine kinase
VEAGALTVASVPVSLGAQTAQVLESWDPEEIRGISLHTAAESRALGDPARVRQIVRNLINNALRHGGDTITIATGRRPEAAWLTVSDDGKGIPAEHRERIFDPYHQVDEAPGPIGGLGLGLAISRQLARLMRGDLTYEYRDGRSTFELSLPAA